LKAHCIHLELSNESALTEERKRVSLGEEKKKGKGKRKEGKKIGTNELFGFFKLCFIIYIDYIII
jgi:hypothetical protein